MKQFTKEQLAEEIINRLKDEWIDDILDYSGCYYAGDYPTLNKEKIRSIIIHVLNESLP